LNNKTFAISGLGSISPRHLEAVKHIGGIILDVHDPDWSKSYFYGRQAVFHKSIESMLEKSEAEWFVILSPSKYHFSQSMKALDLGKKVIVEKPAAMTLYDVLQYSGREIYTVSQLRYLDDIINIKNKISTGHHDVNIKIIAHRHPITMANWRHDINWSGGLMYFVGIHYIDLVTWLFGKMEKLEQVTWLNKQKCQFSMELERATVNASFEITETQPNHKSMIIDDIEIDLAAKFYDLHCYLYEDIMAGHGIHPMDVYHTMEIIHKINGYANEGYGYNASK